MGRQKAFPDFQWTVGVGVKGSDHFPLCCSRSTAVQTKGKSKLQRAGVCSASAARGASPVGTWPGRSSSSGQRATVSPTAFSQHSTTGALCVPTHAHCVQCFSSECFLSFNPTFTSIHRNTTSEPFRSEVPRGWLRINILTHEAPGTPKLLFATWKLP